MKKIGSKIHFPTALGLLILLVAIGVGVFLVKTKTGTNVDADETNAPKQVRITNVSDNGFSVSWLTNSPTSGTVKYGLETSSIKQSAMDDRDQLSGESGSFEVHHVTVKNLTPSSKYFFKLESGGKQFDSNGKPFEVSTGAVLGTPPVADPVYGTILSPSGSVAEGAVVYLNVSNAAPISALAKTNGNWALSLSTARTADLSSYLSYDTQATIVNILVQGGSMGNAPAITTTSNDSPVPDITLGKSHDFRTVADSSVNSLDALAQNKESGLSGSGFDLAPVASDSGVATESGEVTLDNPSFNGEVINATQPAFIGVGPPGTVLSVTVNSENEYTGSATVDEDGNWEFTPPEGLEPGEHTITVNYIDSTGEEQTLSRTFLIAAAGETEVPAITATPSGSVASDSGRTSQPSTKSGVPEPGTWEVTLMMLLSGVGLLFGGVIIKNKV
jgi:hypothetical protein